AGQHPFSLADRGVVPVGPDHSLPTRPARCAPVVLFPPLHRRAPLRLRLGGLRARRLADRPTGHPLVGVLPLEIPAIDYERLVSDREGESRRLIEFLHLEWEPACLDFHRTERPVLTASAWQVRQPVYRHSVGRWCRCARHLSPLLHVLSESAGTA